MNKNILVIYYTQSGQLKEIVDNIVTPFSANQNLTIDYLQIQPEEEYPFPWSSTSFYGAFPASFAQIPTKIKAPDDTILNKEYDLIILAYQIWFLTPSIPISSFMQSAFARQIFNKKKVITLIGCRNMWAKAQSKMKQWIKNVEGELVGNIALVDRNPNLLSSVTIAHWLMTGKKTKKWGIFPKPGIAKEDIENVDRFGKIMENALEKNDFMSLQEEIIKSGGSSLSPFIIFMDEKANKMFSIWSAYILKSKNRKRKQFFFRMYLLFALYIISPIVFLLFMLTYPLRLKQIRKKNLYYCGVK